MSIQFVVTSTGFQSLPSNGTSNAWALYGADALAAVKKLQVRALVLKQLFASSARRLWMLQPLFSHSGPSRQGDKATECRRHRTQKRSFEDGPRILPPICQRAEACSFVEQDRVQPQGLPLHLGRVTFYAACVIAVLLVLRALQICCRRCGMKGSGCQLLKRLSRLELLLLLAFIPAVAAASSGTFSPKKGENKKFKAQKDPTSK